MKRFVFDNVCLKKDSTICILNLMSFRRKFLSIDNFEKLLIIEDKMLREIALENDEDEFFKALLRENQILNEDLLETAEKAEKQALLSIAKVNEITINLTHECNFRCSYCLI